MATYLLGLLLLLLGADSLLRGAAGLGQRLGLSPFAAGLLLVGFAGSIPELVVNGRAVAVGAGELALGNAIGGSFANLGLVLGVGALLAPLAVSMRTVAAELVFVLVAAGLVLLFGLDGGIARWESGVLLAAFLGTLAYWFARGRQEGAAVQAEFAGLAQTATGLVQNLLRIGFAGALLYFGSFWLLQSAPALGAALGLGVLGSGLVLVALGTALPKLLVAILGARGQGNVVVGMVLGACLVNLLLVVGALSLAQPLALPAAFVRTELPAAMAFALLLFPLPGGELRIDRRRGIVLLLAYAAWLVFEIHSARP